MEIQVAAFSDKGKALGLKIFDHWKPEKVTFRYIQNPQVNLDQWTEEGFRMKRALVFIGATGIAVRKIAPFVNSKLEDSPVVVVDELGKNVISLLSGHVGGANELTLRIANELNATPVITTATDLNRKFAIDVFAMRNHLTILKKDKIADISSRLLKSEKVTMAIEGYDDDRINSLSVPDDIELIAYSEILQGNKVDVLVSTEEKLFSNCIFPLKPKEYTLGIGCKRGKTMLEIQNFVDKCGIKCEELYGVASIVNKQYEQGIIDFCNFNRLPYKVYDADILIAIEGYFTSSEFVRSQVGVDNVCERSALKLAGNNGKLIMRKTAENGITLSVGKREWSVNFYE